MVIGAEAGRPKTAPRCPPSYEGALRWRRESQTRAVVHKSRSSPAFPQESNEAADSAYVVYSAGSRFSWRDRDRSTRRKWCLRRPWPGRRPYG